MSINIGGLRFKHKDGDEPFLEQHLAAKEPFGQFKTWFEEAQNKKEILEPNAMCVSTVNKDGFPSARFVLCKGFSKDYGFKFFTNYGSQKARDMAENPNVAVTFYWEYLNRSVRIEGHVTKTTEEESINYFHSRPVESQTAALASPQSSVIECRDVLIEKAKKYEEEFVKNGKEVPKPEKWGGYIIHPRSVEFWKGAQNRLSDRIRFRKPKPEEIPDGKLLHQGEDGWVYERLAG